MYIGAYRKQCVCILFIVCYVYSMYSYIMNYIVPVIYVYIHSAVAHQTFRWYFLAAPPGQQRFPPKSLMCHSCCKSKFSIYICCTHTI